MIPNLGLAYYSRVSITSDLVGIRHENRHSNRKIWIGLKMGLYDPRFEGGHKTIYSDLIESSVRDAK
jgi:hypothetical protein